MPVIESRYFLFVTLIVILSYFALSVSLTSSFFPFLLSPFSERKSFRTVLNGIGSDER